MRAFLMSTVLVAGLATSATAEEEYTVEQLVDFFVEGIELGATRGICIGTAQECETASAPKGLDMRVGFGLDSDVLTEDAKSTLETFAKMMQDERLQIARFVVEGHTDGRGSEDYNLKLSDRRALAVSNYLMGLGIEEDRLTAIGMGESAPRVTDVMDPENRRVELRLDLN